MSDQRDMSEAPRDGTQILVWFQPEPLKVEHRRFARPKRFALVRWFEPEPGNGYWSAHHKGQGKVRGEFLGWWPLPERKAS